MSAAIKNSILPYIGASPRLIMVLQFFPSEFVANINLVAQIIVTRYFLLFYSQIRLHFLSLFPAFF